MRTFAFRNSKQTYTGIPIIVANMDSVGTFEMAQVMTKVSAFHSLWHEKISPAGFTKEATFSEQPGLKTLPCQLIVRGGGTAETLLVGILCPLHRGKTYNRSFIHQDP